MNKRFSTLLATVLVAGSSFSAMAASVEVDTLKYYQIKADSKALIIGQGEDGAKDSLALITTPTTDASLKDYNASLWRIDVDKTTDPTTGARYAVVKLINKNGQQLILSNASAANKSFYYSKPAYVSTSGTGAWAPEGVNLVGEDEVITVADGMFLTTTSYSNGKSTGLYLAYKDDAVKILKVEQDGSVDKLQFPESAGADGQLKLVPALAADELELASTDLNEDVTTDAFSLKFTPDTLASTIGNPFTDNKLVAVDLQKMYSTTVYDASDYEAALEAAKKATTEDQKVVKEAWAAFKAETDAAIKWGAANEFDGKLAEKAGNATDIAAMLTELGQSKTAAAGALEKLTEAGGAKFDAAVTAFDALTKSNAKLDLAAGKDTAAFHKAVADADKAWKALTDSTANAYKAIELVVAKHLSDPNATTKVGPNFSGTLSGAADADRKDMFKSAAGAVYVQYNTTTADLLDALATAAEASMVKTASADIMEGAASGYYALAIKDSLIGGKQAYLCVDTNYIARNEQYFGFKADTLMMVDPENADKGVVADFGQCINLFAFQMVVNPQNVENDEILIKTFMPKPTADGEWYSAGVTPQAANVVLRTLAKDQHREVSVADATKPADAALVKLLKNTVITFSTLEGPRPDFKKGEVYFIKSLKKEDSRKPYRVLTSTTGNDIVGATAVYNNVPATQWFVSTVSDGAYEFTNRDADVAFFSSTKKIIVNDAEKNIYVTADKDTLEITAVPDQKDEYLGYKHINDADKDHLTFKLTATNFVNPEAKYYLTMGADSSVVATADADKALELKAKNGGELEKLSDANLSAASYGFELYLGNDTLYFNEDQSDLLLSKDKQYADNEVKLRRVNDNANQYELLWSEGGKVAANLKSPKIAIDQNGKAAVVAEDEITNWAFNLESAVTESYLNITDAPKNVTISLMGDEASKVTAVKPFAVIKRTGLELKAAATDNDFVLGLDTAYVNRPDNYRYAYYITKPVDTAKVGAFDTKAYMVSYADSIAHNSDTVKYNQDGLTRIGFVHANRVEFGNNDSLAIAKPAAKAADTLNIVGNKGVTPATWAFPIDEDNEGYYRIEVAPAGSSSEKTHVSYLNGVLVLGNKEQAQLFAINDTDLIPTDNETIATSEVTVIAGEGQVTIAGAQGKKVVVSNVLGQVIANTVITSDNAVIAAPQGVVVVAVEGEEAVKAIVK